MYACKVPVPVHVHVHVLQQCTSTVVCQGTCTCQLYSRCIVQTQCQLTISGFSSIATHTGHCILVHSTSTEDSYLHVHVNCALEIKRKYY